MANYPGAIYSPRTKQNRAGVVYDPLKLTTLFAEDVVYDDNEIVAIETELGTNPKGTHSSVKDRFDDDELEVSQHKADTANPHSVTKTQVGLSAVTNDAQMKRADGDMASFTEKTSLAANDIFLIEDSAVSNAKKKTFWSTIWNSITSLFTTAAPTADHSASGIKITLTAAIALAFGDVGYINSSGTVALGDADAIATASCIVMCADASIAQDAAGNFMLIGIARDDTWAWTVGGLIYLSTTGTTANTLTQTAPSGTDDVVQILGVATHADRMFFNPQLIQIERT